MQPLTVPTPKGDILLREARPADAEKFRELRLFALQDSPTSFGGDYQTSLNRPVEQWENRLNPDPDGIIYFAEHANQLLGMAGVRRGESPKTKHGGEVWGFFVRPEWRGLRIAEALIEACIGWARSKDVTIVKLGVLAASTSAVRCYQRCGFTIYGTEPRGIFYEGQYYDGYLMSRDIT